MESDDVESVVEVVAIEAIGCVVSSVVVGVAEIVEVL